MADAAPDLAALAMVWCIGVLMIWSHVVLATRCWDRDREQRMARRRLKRSIAAWEQFRTRQGVSDGQ